ncbi:hypothetical protein RvY_15141 [Ramazzottius varieornatus]|uniref:Uncharacterized protein n=1 Tax=Ramazzottius varieornatus TaxID=947166 RepID=A0A1D1VV79_RAMVA|nr:hypothetical protein RvY_15141 [Ramazzottius varieornatus]
MEQTLPYHSIIPEYSGKAEDRHNPLMKGDRISKIFTMDETWLTLDNCNTEAEYYYTDGVLEIPDDWRKQPVKHWPKKIMVAIGISWNAMSRPYVVDAISAFPSLQNIFSMANSRPQSLHGAMPPVASDSPSGRHRYGTKYPAGPDDSQVLTTLPEVPLAKRLRSALKEVRRANPDEKTDREAQAVWGMDPKDWKVDLEDWKDRELVRNYFACRIDQEDRKEEWIVLGGLLEHKPQAEQRLNIG